MSVDDLVREWKSPEYRAADHPAGEIVLDELSATDIYITTTSKTTVALGEFEADLVA
ncbi:hypothetical protein [Longispora albida]|uniref:hypothetical protein n=1 Tax=Longispora albida TaxID=203523 RepID=UPI00037E3106|nr:hypothetical protein [Longispora albida]